MFKATIDTNRIIVTNPDKEIITSGSVNVNFIQFSFSEDWANLQKTVLFQTKKAQIPIILEGTELVYTMPIPWEVCLYANESINVGAYGTRMDDSETLEDEEVVLPTVWGTIPDKVRQGVIVTDPTPSSPTYNAYQLLLKTISDILENGVGGGSAVSPVVTVEKTDYGHLLTITDIDGEKTVEIRDGVDGVSPTVSVTKIDGGHKVTITDANGAQSFDVMDGEDRQDGTGGGGDADVINRCVWIYEAGNDIALFSEGNTNVASPNEFIGHKPTVSNNNVGLILVDNKLYWIKFNITAANDNSVTQVFTNSPILIGPDVGGEISNELITIKNTSVTNVSQLPVPADKLPCCLHLVNSWLGGMFNDDIVYVKYMEEMMRVFTMDNVIYELDVDPDGSLHVVLITNLSDEIDNVRVGLEYEIAESYNPTWVAWCENDNVLSGDDGPLSAHIIKIELDKFSRVPKLNEFGLLVSKNRWNEYRLCYCHVGWFEEERAVLYVDYMVRVDRHDLYTKDEVDALFEDEVITIKDTEVTNVSQLPMDKFPCALHMVNSTFYYSFSNDIIYVASFPGNIAIWTMDGKIVFFIYGDDGEIIVNQTTSFVDGASLVEQFYTKNEIDSKLANITINDELVTIKDTNITNISQLPIDKSCCVHFVNSFLLYNFVDDIVYIKLQPTSNSIVVFTIDGTITTIYYDYENGNFDFTNTVTDAVATAKYLYENYYEKTEVDNKIANIELTPGPKGEPGKSAYQIAVDNGFEGTETEWLESLKGESSTGGSIPSGGIIIWSGATVPDGWALCNGENGTPDLRGRFVLGESDDYAMGETGGSEEVTLTEAQMPKHYHSIGWNTQSTAQSGTNKDIAEVTVGGSTRQTTEVGGSKPHPNMPPYYVLAYIMKL